MIFKVMCNSIHKKKQFTLLKLSNLRPDFILKKTGEKYLFLKSLVKWLSEVIGKICTLISADLQGHNPGSKMPANILLHYRNLPIPVRLPMGWPVFLGNKKYNSGNSKGPNISCIFWLWPRSNQPPIRERIQF